MFRNVKKGSYSQMECSRVWFRILPLSARPFDIRIYFLCLRCKQNCHFVPVSLRKGVCLTYLFESQSRMGTLRLTDVLAEVGLEQKKLLRYVNRRCGKRGYEGNAHSPDALHA